MYFTSMWRLVKAAPDRVQQRRLLLHAALGQVGKAMRLVLSGPLVACLLAPPAMADPGQAPFPLMGVWSGHIGNLPITACFNDVTPSVTYGSYYYQHRLVPIRLYGYPDEAGKIEKWAETDGRGHANILQDYDGVWQIEPMAPDRLRGTWSMRDGSRQLPIELTKVDGAPSTSALQEGEGSNESAPNATPCGTDAYHRAVEKTVDTFFGPPRKLNNLTYRWVARGFPGRKKHADFMDRAQFIATVELMGDSPTFRGINDVLRQRLSPEREAELVACRRAQFAHGAVGEEPSAEDISVVSASHWLVISVDERHDCGDRGLLAEHTYVWNLSTGQRESLFSWLLDDDADDVNESSAASLSEGGGRLPEALDKFIASRMRQRNDPNRLSWQDIEQCYGPYRPGACTYKLKLVDNGISFEIPPLSGGSCGESLALTFHELRRFLNQEGRQFVAALRRTPKAKP